MEKFIMAKNKEDNGNGKDKSGKELEDYEKEDDRQNEDNEKLDDNYNESDYDWENDKNS